jgi:hypothetical protein
MKKRTQLSTTIIFLVLLTVSILGVTGCKAGDGSVEVSNQQLSEMTSVKH